MEKDKENIWVTKLGENDLQEFMQSIRLFEKVFEMKDFSMPDSPHLEKLLKKKDFFVFVACKGKKIIGALTAYVLEQYYSKRPLAYIYDLAIDNEYQSQGIGSLLITTINQYCRERDFEEVFVQADKADGYALDFYRTNRPSNEEAVVHFTYIF